MLSTAKAAQLLLSAGDVSHVVAQVLKLAGESAGADRAYIFEHHIEDQTGQPLMTQRYEWCRPGVEAQLDNPEMQALPYDPVFTRLLNQLKLHQPYKGAVRTFPPLERDFLERQDIRALLVLPLVSQGKLWGFIGFDACREERVWDETEEAALSALASCLGAALARQSAVQQLRDRDTLLRGVAHATRDLLTAPDFDTGLHRALATLGEAAGVDRAYIFENTTHARDGRRMGARYVWSRESSYADASVRQLQDLSYDELFPRWYDILSAGRPISGRVLDFFAQPGGTPPALRSILLVPVTHEGGFWGLVGFDDGTVTRAWAPADESILHAVADSIGGAIARQRAEEALRTSEEHFRTLIENASDIIAILSPDVAFDYLSPAVERALGYAPSDLIGRKATDLVHPEDLMMMEQVRDVMAAQPEVIRTAEFRMRHRDGSWRTLEGMAKVLDEQNGRRDVVNARDITARRKAESALRQSTELLRHSQKMEAVGRLAGGVAHDFNNLLTAIMGYAEIVLERLGEQDAAYHEVEEICKAADRAHALTRQLLAFSRKQILEPRVCNLNAVVADMDKLLRRLIGEDIEFATTLDRDLAMVLVDPGQMEQVIINLAVNARDAMPEGGTLELATRNTILREPLARGHLTVEPGAYVVLSVRDTGIGMDDYVLAHLFEPFFTSKEVGKGTGLGLSMVYGIMEQSGGHILFDSTPGKGTTFTLYLPRLQASSIEQGTVRDKAASGGTERILLVEDEDMVRELATRVLKERGYDVSSARSGTEALRNLGQEAKPFDLLLTDIVMPQVNGRELALRARERIPGLRVLFMSGYAEEGGTRKDDLVRERVFIQKPFTPAALARKVRDVLDAP